MDTEWGSEWRMDAHPHALYTCKECQVGSGHVQLRSVLLPFVSLWKRGPLSVVYGGWWVLSKSLREGHWQIPPRGQAIRA